MSSATPTTPALPACTTAAPDHYGYVPPNACNANYGFYPSWEWNLTFAVAFGLTTLVHLVQMVTFAKYFCWVVVMGSLWECLCFVLRTLGAHDQQNGTYVVVSTLLFLLAPLWINAFAYMLTARLIYFLLPQPSQKILGLSPYWLAKAFVVADVVAFLVQAGGGGMLADQDGGETVETGRKIYMVGIGIQLGFVMLFVGVAGIFTLRLRRAKAEGLLERDGKWVWPLVGCVFAVMGLIVVRVIFRFVEFGSGVSSSNPILANETYQLCLDALPMLVALIIMNAVHPGKVLKGPESSFPKRKWWRRPEAKAANDEAYQSLDSSGWELNSRERAQGQTV